MSGDSSPSPVLFIARGSDSFAVDAFTAIAELPRDLPPWALIGGVAVAINLSGFHRPTADIDSVCLDGEAAVSLLVAHGAARSRNGVTLSQSGVAVSLDIIDVSSGPPDHGSYLAHRYALDSALTIEVEVRDQSSRLLASASARVATPGALVAMKAHSVDERRRARPEKRVGDLYDVVRIVGTFGTDIIASELAAARPELIESIARHLEPLFVTNVARSLRELRNDGRGIAATVDRIDLEIVSELVVALRRR